VVCGATVSPEVAGDKELIKPCPITSGAVAEATGGLKQPNKLTHLFSFHITFASTNIKPQFHIPF
jgi:hypothetical protein